MANWIDKHGFLGLVVLAAVPNCAFDFAGMWCGYHGVPFARFFGATLLGKGVIRISLQALLLIMVFNDAYLGGLTQQEPLQGWMIAVRGAFEAREEDHEHSLTPSIRIIKTAWLGVMMLFLVYSIVCLVEYVAREREKELREGLRLKGVKVGSSIGHQSPVRSHALCACPTAWGPQDMANQGRDEVYVYGCEPSHYNLQ
jgi:hypothetical protein